MDQKSIRIASKMKLPRQHPKMPPKSAQLAPKMDPSWGHVEAQNRLGSVQGKPEIDIESEGGKRPGPGEAWGARNSHGGPDFPKVPPDPVPFWSQLGTSLGPKMGPCWGHEDQKINFLTIKKAMKNSNDFE